MRTFRFSVLLSLLFAIPSAFASDFYIWQQLTQGGIGIVAVAGLSIVALTVTIERLWNLRASTIVPPGLAEQAQALWREGRFDELDSLLAIDKSVLARVLRYLVTYRHQSMIILSSGAGDIASIELRQHQRKIYPLSVVATIAPIVGLLGTVVGMIEAFHVIAFSGAMGDPALLAGGISKALINTAAGLTVALPSLAIYHYFKSRISAYGLALEKDINLLINMWFMQASNVAPSVPLHVINHAH
jgi:biopolymer transport protein ExbB